MKWPRFRLRSLLVLVALAAVARGGFAGWRRSRENARHAQQERPWAILADDAARLARMLGERGDPDGAKRRSLCVRYRRSAN